MLQQAGLTLAHLNVIEFKVVLPPQMLACAKEMSLLNIHNSISLGHPLGPQTVASWNIKQTCLWWIQVTCSII